VQADDEKYVTALGRAIFHFALLECPAFWKSRIAVSHSILPNWYSRISSRIVQDTQSAGIEHLAKANHRGGHSRRHGLESAFCEFAQKVSPQDLKWAFSFKKLEDFAY
jgi:hypothetical protein